MIKYIKNLKNRINYFFGEVQESTLFFLRMPGWLFGIRCRACLVVINIFLVVAFVLQIAAASGSGYELKRLEVSINNINKEQQRLEAEIAVVSSLSNLKNKSEGLAMINAPRLKHLDIPVTVVAVNQR